MPSDVVVAQELKSLQEEFSTSQKERVAASAVASSPPAPSAEPVRETQEERDLRDQLRELASEVTDFFEDTEKSIAAHPAQSVIGALLVGILIGRLLGRR